MKLNKLVLIFIIAFLLIFTSCQTTPTQETSEDTEHEIGEQETTSVSDAYPAADPQSTEDQAYPVATDSESQVTYPEGPEFTIHKPVKEGDTEITGVGPADVPIILVDVTEAGTLLGKTTINQDGTFSFQLSDPLESGHSVGIQLGDISGTDFNLQDFQFSPTYYDRPYIGILFDIANVE